MLGSGLVYIATGLFVPKPTPWLVALRQCAPDLGATVRQRLLEYVPGRWDRYSVSYSASAFGGSGGTSTAPGADQGFVKVLGPV